MRENFMGCKWSMRMKGNMEAFAELIDKIDQTQSTNEKVSCIQQYFESATAEDAAWALFFLSGNRLKRFVSSRLLLEWCQQETDLPEWLVGECYDTVGDTAETVALLLRPIDMPIAQSKLSLSHWMEERILPLREETIDRQKIEICSCWRTLDRKGCFVLNKILTGSLRIGVSQLLTLSGLSKAYKIPRENLSQRLMGNWEPTKEFFEFLVSKNNLLQENLNPYPFYLASPWEGEFSTLGDPKKWFVEWKWDGIRAQAISRGGMQALWSRGNELISDQFPEIMHTISHLPAGIVLDGEILAYREGKPLPFAELQKRLNRKSLTKKLLEEVPVAFMIYDVLEYESKDIRQMPLQDRKVILETVLQYDTGLILSERLTVGSWDELVTLREGAKVKATEGLMIKKADSPFGVGRQRGSWWKYKVDPMTIDAVLLYAQAGKGRRANLYTDYTFGVWDGEELVPIAKAYSGLEQKEIDELDKWIRRNTLEKFGPVRKVKAEQVFEIAFEGIQKSNRHKSGIALRFPRIARWRLDKPFTECDTIQGIKKEFFNE